MTTVDMSVIPKRREAFVVVTVEMGKEMLEGVPGKGFAEVEIVYDNICIGNYA